MFRHQGAEACSSSVIASECILLSAKVVYVLVDVGAETCSSSVIASECILLSAKVVYVLVDVPCFIKYRISWRDTLISPGNGVAQIFVIVLNRWLHSRAKLRYVTLIDVPF
jgi:hypothetical protein